jgi:trehalose-phosphatase
LLRQWPCVFLEEKGIAFSLHYRNCADKAVRNHILAVLALVGQARAKIVEGKQVVEVVPAELPDKGWAFGRLLAAHAIESVVYLGDDLSDVPVFLEVRRRREAGLPGLALAVVDAETPQAVIEGADLALPGVAGTSAFLAQLVATLPARADQSQV